MTKKRILLIDDNLSLMGLNAKALSRHGFDVETAPGGLNALSLLKTRPPPDLIFVDFIMPGMDGIEFLKNLQRIDSFKDIPVILMTAESHPEILMEMENLKLAGLMIKPVTAVKLVERVQLFFKRDK